MFVLQIKDSALEANQRVRELVAAEGARLEFGSRADAEFLAADLCTDGGRVRVQKAAPQDQAGVDGYLIRFPRRHKYEPKTVDGSRFTFDVTANQYGELGRALVHGAYGVSPAIKHYLHYEHGHSLEQSQRFRAVPEPDLPADLSAEISWSPDLLIQPPKGTPGPGYYCEIKAGAASFQRGQFDDMKRVAQRHNVLKIRVDITNLPTEYTVRIDQVTPD